MQLRCRCRRVQVYNNTLAAGTFMLAVWHAAAINLNIRSLNIEAGTAYNWQVTSMLQSPHNVTLYGNETATATFNVVAKRVSAGTGYTVSGRVTISNSGNQDPVAVERVRLLLGPRLPLFGPTPRTLDCGPRNLQPGSTMSCPFRFQFSNTLTKTLTPSLLFGARRSFSGEATAIEYPEPAVNASGCATITDKIVAGGAEQGITSTGSTTEVAALLGQGLQVCSDSASWTYTAKLGPFGVLDVCGQYQFSNAPVVDAAGIGSSDVHSASGNLFISGCRQKDALGLLKPAISISRLSLGNLANSSWMVSTNSTSVTPGLSLSAVPHSATVTVKSTIQINKTTSQSVSGLMGVITVLNNQVVPYVVAGVRVIVTPNDTAVIGTTAAANQQQVVLDAKCPLTSQGTIVIQPQLLGDKPGMMRCTFTVPLESSLRSGTVQAQLRTVFSSTYEVDSGLPTPYSFPADATAAEDASACVEVWAERFTDASVVQAADMDVNPDLSAAMDSLTQPGTRLLGPPKRVVSGRVPPSQGSLLAIPYQVCGNKSIEWTETYGPFTSDSCGLSKSVMAVFVKPTTDKNATVNTVLSVPITVKGCGLVPQASVEEVLLTAKKVYQWSVKTTQLTPSLTIPYDQKSLAKYNVSYTRDYSITNRKVQALFKVVNTLSQPVNIAKVTYSISRPDGELALTGTAICNETFAGAAQAAMNAALVADFANSSLPASQSSLTAPGPTNGVTSFTLPAALAITDTPQQAAAPLTPAKTPSRLKFFNLDISMITGNKAEAGSSGGGYVQGNQGTLPEADTAIQSAPEPFYCSFVVNTRDDFPSEVSVNVVTDRFEETQAVAPYKLDWSLATNYEAGRCALASTFFQQTQPASLLQPAALSGLVPPRPENAAKICDPTSYNFQALFGPFTENECGDKQALVYAGVSVPGLQNITNDIGMTEISITDCPGIVPVITMGTATATQVTATYDWSIERVMRPLGASADVAVVSVAAVNARAATAKAVELTAGAGGVALFNQTVTFRRSAPVARSADSAQYMIKGSVLILNPADEPMQIREIQVKVIQAQPMMVKADCPVDIVKANPSGKGSMIVVPPSTGKAGDASVTCGYSATVSAGSSVDVVAVAVLPDGRWAKASNLNIDLTAAKPVVVGNCMKIHETQALLDLNTNATLEKQAVLVGSKVPPTAEELCYTKTFQAIGQIGPLPASSSSHSNARMAAAAGCGGVVYHSTVTAQPTSMAQGKLVSAGSIIVVTAGC